MPPKGRALTSQGRYEMCKRRLEPRNSHKEVGKLFPDKVFFYSDSQESPWFLNLSAGSSGMANIAGVIYFVRPVIHSMSVIAR